MYRGVYMSISAHPLLLARPAKPPRTAPGARPAIERRAHAEVLPTDVTVTVSTLTLVDMVCPGVGVRLHGFSETSNKMKKYLEHHPRLLRKITWV